MQLGNTCLLGWLKKVIRKDSSQLCHSSGISCRNIMVLCFVISNCTVHLNLSQMAWWNDPVKSMPVCSNMTSISGKEHKGAFGMWAGFMWLSVHMHPNMWPMGSGYWHFTVVPILHWCYCISVNIPIYTLKMCEPDPFESGTECSLNLYVTMYIPFAFWSEHCLVPPWLGKGVGSDLYHHHHLWGHLFLEVTGSLHACSTPAQGKLGAVPASNWTHGSKAGTVTLGPVHGIRWVAWFASVCSPICTARWFLAKVTTC